MRELTTGQTDCLKLMESLPLVEVTTLDRNGYPSTRAMLNLRDRQEYPEFCGLYAQEENPLTVYLTTNVHSEKLCEIARCKKSSLYFCDPKVFGAVLLQGELDLVTDQTLWHKIWQKGWEVYYPSKAEHVILKFIPNRLKLFSGGVLTEEAL
jgi:general stress protein 26